MGKYNFTDTVAKIQDSYKTDERRAGQFGLGNSLPPISHDPKDYVVMPPWWLETFGILGIRFGHFVQVAGEPDSGKTTLSLLAILCAQQQGYAVIYVETEGKTGPEDLAAAGIDPDGVIIVHTKITEEVYDGIATASEKLFADYPDAKVLLVIDSFGNTNSLRDSTLNLTTASEKPGGHGKTNRTGLGQIGVMQLKHEIAVLVVNYTYDNIGSVGKTNAGGKAVNFFSMLTLQTSRTAWYERTAGGQKVRAGADVKWRVYKNHYAKSLKNEKGEGLLLPAEINMRISGEGLKVLPPSAPKAAK